MVRLSLIFTSIKALCNNLPIIQTAELMFSPELTRFVVAVFCCALPTGEIPEIFSRSFPSRCRHLTSILIHFRIKCRWNVSVCALNDGIYGRVVWRRLVMRIINCATLSTLCFFPFCTLFFVCLQHSFCLDLFCCCFDYSTLLSDS